MKPMRTRSAVIIIACALLVGAAPASWAQYPFRGQGASGQRQQAQGRRQRARQRHLRSPRAAARAAQRRFGGRVLSVQLERGGGAPVYRVKLISDGVVRVVRVPASR